MTKEQIEQERDRFIRAFPWIDIRTYLDEGGFVNFVCQVANSDFKIWLAAKQDSQVKEDISKLYYEAHITIEPVFDFDRDYAGYIAEDYGFKLAHLLMKKRKEDTEERSSKDTFMTGHSKSFKDLEQRTKECIIELQASGFKVWRYKIEDTILDSRTEDVFNLIK